MLATPSMFRDPAWCWKVLYARHTSRSDKRMAREWLRYHRHKEG